MGNAYEADRPAARAGGTFGRRHGPRLAALAALSLALWGCNQPPPNMATSYRASDVFAAHRPTPIPFGGPAVAGTLVSPGPAPAPAPGAPRLGARFEFVELAQGYDLFAVAEDRTRGQRHRLRIGRCATIDIDSFDESERSLFATPAICDGRSYAIDLVGNRIVVVGPAGARTLLTVPSGRVVLNGVPVLAGA